VLRWNDVSEVPEHFGPSVVTIGNFDGVHLGHRSVLAHLVATARARDAEAVAITFDPHPLQVLHPDRAPQTLTGLDHRVELIAAAGLDAVLVMEFTHQLATWSPERFVEDVIVDRLHASVVVVGRDIRFGHRNSGDLQTMRELGEKHGFGVELLDDLTGPAGGCDGAGTGDRRWSSSWARELLAAGEVGHAADVLGRPHRVVGEVVHGDHRGRELGYPTANLAPDSVGMVPADGVYAGWMLRMDVVGDPEHPQVHDRFLPAAISVGSNPTFDGTQRRVEAYVLDRTDLDLYGERVALEFVSRLRETLRFEDAGALVQQMARDVQQCREVLEVVSPKP
jgi:riboflavin kinase/FMN adenylyltransferase